MTFKLKHPDKRLIHLDALRGISILVVVLAHYGFLWRFESHLVGTPFYIAGVHGVALFFVLSGYFCSALFDKTPGVLAFIVNRYRRIMPTFLFCAIIAFCFEIVFYKHLDANRQSTLYELVQTLIYIPTLGIGQDVFNFTQGVYWSLVVEFKYYILFSVLGLLFKGQVRLKIIILSILGVGAILIPPSTMGDFLMWMPFFVFGAVLFEMNNNISKMFLFVPIVSFLLLFLFEEGNYSESFKGVEKLSYVWVFTLSYIVLQYGKGVEAGIIMKILALFGLISFPLYLLHQEFGMVMFAVFSDINYYFVFLFCFVSVVIFSLIIHHKIEKKFMSYSKGSS